MTTEEISSALQSLSIEGDLVDNVLPLSIPEIERRRIWNEEAPRWALSWAISVEEYLQRADNYIRFLRQNKKVVSGREALFRNKGIDLVAYNEVWSPQYGKMFTIDDLHMFRLRG